MNTQIKAKKKQNNYANQNPLEVLKGLGLGVRDSLVDDLGKKGINDAWDELLGVNSTQEAQRQNSGDLIEGQEISLSKKKKEEKEVKRNVAPAIDYHREISTFEKKANQEEKSEIQLQIQEIRIEIDKIAETSMEIRSEFKEVTVDQRIEDPGEYHSNFFSWILSLLRKARISLEDSRTGVGLVQSKSKGKKYWAMFKKHGTSFGLSNERVVATQTG